jgi:hypothetical protein
MASHAMDTRTGTKELSDEATGGVIYTLRSGKTWTTDMVYIMNRNGLFMSCQGSVKLLEEGDEYFKFPLL